jgi:DNA polymerase-3 subunit epsilon
MLKNLCINRPIVFIDVETTGIDPHNDRIIEIAMLRYDQPHKHRCRTIRIHPECPIPTAASSIHGIRDEHVAHCKPFRDEAEKIARFIGRADLAGFGICRFDIPFLIAEFDRAGWNFPLRCRKVVDAMRLYHHREPRNLASALRFYCKREHPRAHNATHDVRAAVAVLEAMLARYDDAPKAVAELHALLIPVDVEGWFKRVDGIPVFAKGKHRDKPLHEVAAFDSSYLNWVRQQALPDAKGLIERVLEITEKD